MSRFPDSVVVEGDVLKDLIQMSDFFFLLDKWEGHKPSYTLTADSLFDGDKNAWRLFIDIFIPEVAPQDRGIYPFAYLPNGQFWLNENMYIQEYVNALFDYLMIDPKLWHDVMKYLASVHYSVQGNPEPPAPLGIKVPMLRSGYNANLTVTPTENENTGNNNSNTNINLNRFTNTNIPRAKTRKLKKKNKQRG